MSDGFVGADAATFVEPSEPWPVLETSHAGRLRRLVVSGTPIRSPWFSAELEWSQEHADLVIRGLRRWGEILTAGLADPKAAAPFARWWVRATDAALYNWLFRAAPTARRDSSELAEALAGQEATERWTTEQITAALGAGGPERWLAVRDLWRSGRNRERVTEAIARHWGLLGDAATWLLASTAQTATHDDEGRRTRKANATASDTGAAVRGAAMPAITAPVDEALLQAIVAGLSGDTAASLEAVGLPISGWAWDGRLAIVVDDTPPGFSTHQTDEEQSLELITLVDTVLVTPDADSRWARQIRRIARPWPQTFHIPDESWPS